MCTYHHLEHRIGTYFWLHDIVLVLRYRGTDKSFCWCWCWCLNVSDVMAWEWAQVQGGWNDITATVCIYPIHRYTDKCWKLAYGSSLAIWKKNCFLCWIFHTLCQTLKMWGTFYWESFPAKLAILRESVKKMPALWWAHARMANSNLPPPFLEPQSWSTLFFFTWRVNPKAAVVSPLWIIVN